MAEFYSEKVVTIREPRNCAGCGTMMNKGDQALSYSGRFNGEFGSFSLHTDCREAELAWNKMAGTFADEFVGLGEVEPDDWPWLLESYPTVAARMNITAERIADHQAEQKRMQEWHMEQARKREAERLDRLAARAKETQP